MHSTVFICGFPFSVCATMASFYSFSDLLSPSKKWNKTSVKASFLFNWQVMSCLFSNEPLLLLNNLYQGSYYHIHIFLGAQVCWGTYEPMILTEKKVFKSRCGFYGYNFAAFPFYSAL